MEDKIKNLINETIESLGFNLVQVIIKGGEYKILEILIENSNNEPISVGDCQKASKNISAILDVEDVISDKYFLEVSSAGIERPLTKIEDYKKYIGREAKIRLKELAGDSYSHRGVIKQVSEENIIIVKDKEELIIQFDNIKKAKLSITEEMFKKMLNKKSLKS